MMDFRDIWARIVRRLRIKLGFAANTYFPFAAQELDPSEAENLQKTAQNDLEKLFYNYKGRVVHKWLHYLPIYEREFSSYRDKKINFLEIGVFKGGSIELWRKYFGPKAQISGIDVNPECEAYVKKPNNVFIGSQADKVFLSKVINNIGAPDIILDDGSHIANHQMTSFRELFPQLKIGGLYIIEDLHTAYWPGYYEGGYRRTGTAIELAKTLVDDMHSWYHKKGSKLADKTEIASVRFYDSMVVIEKGDISMPQHIKVI